MKMRREHCIAVIITFFFIFCLFPCFTGRAADLADPVDDETLSKLQEYKRGLLELEGDIAVQQGEINEEKRKEKRILNQIAQLDRELNIHQQKLNTLLMNSARQRNTITMQNMELDDLEKQRKEVVNHLKKRGSAFYMLGNIGLFNAVFSSHSLPELLTFRASFKELMQYDRKVLQAYGATLDLQRRSRDSLELENIMMQDFVQRAQEEKEQVEIARNKLEQKLNTVKGKRASRKQAIRELREISHNISQAMANVQDDFAKKQQEFLESKGTLPMPIENGTVVTRYHHMSKSAFGEKVLCRGIEIRADDHSNVRAIGSGKVVYAGYLEGYGNTVIINHGMQYYTVTARLEEITTKNGKYVEQNENIGRSGITATLFTDGLYFEIRHKQKQQNPLLWIDKEAVHFE